MKRLALALIALAAVGPFRSAQAASPASTARVAYVALGDGLTLGNASYVHLLARHLPHGSAYRNLASPYGTLADVISSELPETLAARPGVVTVWLGGGNDGRVNTAPATYKRELRRLLGALQGIGARVFIGTVPNSIYMTFFTNRGQEFAQGAASQSRAFNAAITAVAPSYGATVVDIYSVTKRIWGNPKDVAPDGLHLAAGGQAAVAALFYKVMHRKGAL